MKKQADLPGVEGPGVGRYQNDAIDEAVDKFVKARDHATLMKERAGAAEDNVKKLLHEHAAEIGTENGEIIYRCDDEVVVLKPGKDKLIVRSAPEVS